MDDCHFLFWLSIAAALVALVYLCLATYRGESLHQAIIDLREAAAMAKKIHEQLETPEAKEMFEDLFGHLKRASE